MAAEHSRAAESDGNACEPTRIFGRRELFWRGIVGAARMALMATGANTLLNTVEGSGFVLTAPHYENRAACKTVAHFGNISDLVSQETCTCADVGDSLARGCNDFNWAWAGPAQLLSEDMNLVLAASGVPRPRHGSSAQSPYFQNIMLARGGSTISQVRHQIIELHRLEGSADSRDVPIVVMSAGGNNALQFLLHNLVPTLLGGFVNTFKNMFLPQFEQEYKPLLADLIAQREASSTANQHLFILGVTDIGKSTLIPPLRIWGISQLATAACRHINNTILDIIEDLQRDHPRVQLHFIDIFTDLYDNPIVLGGIHPTRPEYTLIVDKIKSRCTADFPDGANTFIAEQAKYGIRPRVAT